MQVGVLVISSVEGKLGVAKSLSLEGGDDGMAMCIVSVVQFD